MTCPDEIVRGIAELEPLPVTASALVGLLGGEDVAVGRIAEVIEFDQAIAAAVLRASSTAAFGWRTPASVSEAVLRLGTVALLNLVLRSYLARVGKAAPLYDLSEDELWTHGAAAQLAVQSLSEQLPALRLPPMAPTAALLHDVGKLVTSRYLRITAADVARCAAAEGLTFVEAERRLCGTDHAEVGGAIARVWKFPPELEEAIGRHHDTVIGGGTPMLDAVVVANLVAKSVGAGLGAEGLNLSVDSHSAARLGVTYPVFARVCLRTEERLRELRASVADSSRKG